jgi:hypothetical protein
LIFLKLNDDAKRQQHQSYQSESRIVTAFASNSMSFFAMYFTAVSAGADTALLRENYSIADGVDVLASVVFQGQKEIWLSTRSRRASIRCAWLSADNSARDAMQR